MSSSTNPWKPVTATADRSSPVFLCGLGNRPYGPTKYHAPGGAVIEARTPCGAILNHEAARLGPAPRIVLLATREAWDANGDALKLDASEAGMSPDVVRHEAIEFHDCDAPALMTRIVDAIGDAPAVWIDISGGPRQLPLVLSASTRFVEAGRTLPTRVWFAQIGATADGDAQLLDLTDLRTIDRLASAERELRRYGRAEELCDWYDELFADIDRRARAAGTEAAEKPGQISALSRKIRGASAALINGLSIDLAEASLGRSLERHAASVLRRLPMTETVLGRIVDQIAQHTVGKARRKITLDMREIRRQLGLVDAALLRDDVSTAVRTLDEIVVNRILLERKQTDGDRWLDYRHTRRSAGASWNRLPDGHALSRLRKELKTLRDAYAHAGFRIEPCDPIADRDKVRELLAQTTSLIEHFDHWSDCVPPAGEGTLILTALGLSPGVLSTLLRGVEAARGTETRLLLLTSQAALEGAERAMVAAEFDASHAEFILFDDPFVTPLDQDLPTLTTRSGRAVDEILGEARDLVIQSAGGATALRVLLERIAERGRQAFERPERRCVAVDRRTADEQRGDPFGGGELVWIEEPGYPDRC